MSIKVLELAKNSEMGDLSIDKQKMVRGGVNPTYDRSVKNYNQSLTAYADGKANISSSGDIVTFVSSDGRPMFYSGINEYGIGVSGITETSYKVQNNNVTEVGHRII
jgi:hypothetical protein